MPLASASFAVIGLTNGPGWVPNPCLAQHVAWAKARGVWTAAYSMTTYPTAAQRSAYGATGPWSAATRDGRLRNAGYQQAMFNVASMRTAGLAVPFVWVDVEPYPTHPWSRDVLANRQVVRGVVRAYQDQGYGVGFYSYTNGWRAVVGSWRKPGFAAWVPVGPVSNGLAVASRRCSAPSFSGGPVLLAQWVQDARDRDVTCPLLHGRADAPHPLTALVGTTLRPGDAGPAVTALQRAMLMRPQYVTGRFDLRTERVLLALQRSRGLPLTGVATDVELSAAGCRHRPARPAPTGWPTSSRRTDPRFKIVCDFEVVRLAGAAGVSDRPHVANDHVRVTSAGQRAPAGSGRPEAPSRPCCGPGPCHADVRPSSRATSRGRCGQRSSAVDRVTSRLRSSRSSSRTLSEVCCGRSRWCAPSYSPTVAASGSSRSVRATNRPSWSTTIGLTSGTGSPASTTQT